MRPAPRKPGQSADVSCSRETGAGAALGALLGAGAGKGDALAAGAGASDGDAAGSGVVTATGSSAACASSFSSWVFDQRHARSLSKSLLLPPVRRSVNAAKVASMAAAMVARRAPSRRRFRVATAQATNAIARTGSASTQNRFPIPPPRIDACRRGGVAKNPRATRATASTRSCHGARLAATHQIRTRTAAAKLVSRPYSSPSSHTTGTMYRATSTMAASAMPGHSRSGFPGGGASVVTSVV